MSERGSVFPVQLLSSLSVWQQGNILYLLGRTRVLLLLLFCRCVMGSRDEGGGGGVGGRVLNHSGEHYSTIAAWARPQMTMMR